MNIKWIDKNDLKYSRMGVSSLFHKSLSLLTAKDLLIHTGGIRYWPFVDKVGHPWFKMSLDFCGLLSPEDSGKGELIPLGKDEHANIIHTDGV